MVKRYLAGNESFMIENKIDLSFFRTETKKQNIQNSSVIFLALEKQLKGFISVFDSIKKNSIAAVEKIKQLKIEPILLSGDNESVTKYISHLTGIEKYESSVLPENKTDKVKIFKK